MNQISEDEQMYTEEKELSKIVPYVNYFNSDGSACTPNQALERAFQSGYGCGYVKGYSRALAKASKIVEDLYGTETD